MASTGKIELIRDPELRQLAADVYANPVVDWTVDDGRKSPYRQQFRKTVPVPVQDALAAACGDRIIREGDYAGIPAYLDYPCDPEIAPEEAAAVARTLRDDPQMLPLLRLQITTTGTNLGGLDSIDYVALRGRMQEFVKAAH